jgi:Mg-chelatase subunit ChlD
MKFVWELSKKQTSVLTIILSALFITLSGFTGGTSNAETDPATNLQGYGLKIFHVESGLYPFVQAYIRTFDQNMNPLINLNEMNIGLMVKGHAYRPDLRQFFIQSIRNRNEAIRSILLVDTSKTMNGGPFEAALQAAARYIDAKRPQDQVAIIALEDNKEGYSVISNFERDPGALGRRLADLNAKGQKTRLFDGIAAALQLSASSGAGGTNMNEADYVASTSIVIFSDGMDENSAITRDDLMTRLTNMKVPVPIYTLAYTKIYQKYLRNLQALSKNSFGKYSHIGEAYDQMTRSVENIQDILQSDYVVTFRSYLPVDGEQYNLKIGVEYPTGSGKVRYGSSSFETIAPPAFPQILEAQGKLNEALPSLPDGNPYISNPFAPKP